MELRVGNTVYSIVHESKDIGTKKTDDMQDILATFSKALSPVRDKNAYRKAKYEFDKVQANFRTNMQSNIDKLKSGEITANQFRARARKEFKSAYEKSFELGKKAVGNTQGLTDKDKKWLDKIRSSEYKYLDKFINDVISGKGSMDYSKRMDMYIDGLHSVYDSGRVDGMPVDGTKVYWITTPAEHCPDCLELSSASPYSPETLPTTPKSGYTRCLSNCKCYLRISYKTPDTISKEIGIYKKARGYESIDNKVINWNVVDKIASVLFEDSVLRQECIGIREEELDEIFDKSIDQYDIQLDIYSEEFNVLHRLGAYIRDMQLGLVEDTTR